ncbi:hypothetical protein PN499_23035 [Kamptonema animale CS-326]|jgi:hypothetical protein|uniref:hypothetical protein n=1 Tax=Kamptonema animale TaxID=92934 RepID=UPI00232FC59F|nr:hypothetical protein [Kamptonema animale]MDB9514079.1 hypothetical protein [Kamptonema animale CS-326]
MTQTSNTRPIRRGRIFPEIQWPPEKIAQRKAEREVLYRQHREILDRVKPGLIADHYNWFIIIEVNSGDYFIDPDEGVAIQKARQKYPSGWLGIFRLNETGTCGKI